MSVRLPGGLLVLTALECAGFAHVRAELLAGWRRDGIVPPQLVEALASMRAVADEAALGFPAPPGRRGSGGGSGAGPKMDCAGSAAPELMLTVRQAAEVAKVSERCIRKAIYSGRLVGRRVGDGSRWSVTAASVDAYAPRQSNQAREAS